MMSDTAPYKMIRVSGIGKYSMWHLYLDNTLLPKAGTMHLIPYNPSCIAGTTLCGAYHNDKEVNSNAFNKINTASKLDRRKFSMHSLARGELVKGMLYCCADRHDGWDQIVYLGNPCIPCWLKGWVTGDFKGRLAAVMKSLNAEDYLDGPDNSVSIIIRRKAQFKSLMEGLL